MEALDGPRLKVQRAESEIEALRSIDQAFMLDSDYDIFRAELNPKTGMRRYRIRINSSPPSLDWGVARN